MKMQAMEQGIETNSQAAFDEGVAALQAEYGQAFDQRIKLAQSAAKLAWYRKQQVF